MTAAMAIVQAPENPRSLSSMSEHELMKEVKAADETIKINSELLKTTCPRANEGVRADLARCQTALDAAEKAALGFKQVAAAEQAYEKWKANMPASEQILGLDMTRIFEGGFSTAASKVNAPNLSCHKYTL